MSDSNEKSTQEKPAPITPIPKKGARFWLIFTSMCICLFLSTLEVSSVPTALPTIANALHATQFTWVGSAYALASTAFLPMSGGLAQTFGRRPAMLITLGLFALGSGICGGAKSMGMLIAGRTIQGLGGGGIQSLTGVILADLVTLQDRGVYTSIYGFIWCLTSSFAPVVGGTLADQGQWRWLFYLNIPISLVAFISVILFMSLPVPPGSYRDKFMRMDWIGNFLVIASTTACAIGLTWGGITSPWSSATVLVPLILGFVGFGAFMACEATLAKYPLIPLSVMTNVTSISGYIQTFICNVIISAVGYYFPVYLQACKGASPILSGVYSLSFASIACTAVFTGLLVKTTSRYRPYMWMGWIIIIIALSLTSTIHTTNSIGESIGFALLTGCGLGILQATPMYPIQAPLPITQSAPALVFMWFLRSLGFVCGITIGSTVLQNELAKKLPTSFIESVPQGTTIMYALIPELATLPPQTRFQVQVAFASSLAVLRRVLTAMGGAGLFVSLFMKAFPLHNMLDAEWALKGDKADESAT